MCSLDIQRDLCRDPDMSQPCDACVTSSLLLTLVCHPAELKTHKPFFSCCASLHTKAVAGLSCQLEELPIPRLFFRAANDAFLTIDFYSTYFLDSVIACWVQKKEDQVIISQRPS